MSSITLYKWEAKSKKFRSWKAEIVSTDKGEFYIEIKTQLGDDGKITVRKKKIETMKTKSPEEKVKTVFNRLKNDKIDKSGYSEKKTTELGFYPMIFKDYTSNTENNNEKILAMKNIVLQYKLDGVRAYYYDEKLYARSGAEINSIPHIKDEIAKLVLNYGDEKGTLDELDILLDGEVYLHNNSDYYVTDIAGIINSKEVSEKAYNLEYHVFDLYWHEHKDLSYIERYKILQTITTNQKLSKINILPIKIIKNDGKESVLNEINKYLKESLSNNYEGIIIRNGEEEYKPATGKSNGRSNDYKYKGTNEDEFKILNIETANRDVDITVIFILEDITTSKTFKVTGSGKFEYQKKIYENKADIIGKKLRIKYYGITSDGLPFHSTPIKKNGKYVIV